MKTLTPILLLLLLLQNAKPPDCAWAAAVETGRLDESINESSGLAISRRYPGRMYHINDSGDDGRLFVTGFDGGNARAVALAGGGMVDTEALSLAPCGTGTDCLVIADMGDNNRDRRSVEIVVVEESADFPVSVRSRNRIRLTYPDGPHNVEAVAAHPDGNIYILTKGLDQRGLLPLFSVPRIYRLKSDSWQRPGNSTAVLEFVTEIDFGKLLPGALLGGRVPTGMDISPDGTKAIVLMYENAVELLVNLSGPLPAAGAWKEGVHYRRIPLVNLEQQEAVAYLPDGNSLIYTTERRNGRIMTVNCRP